MGNFFTSFLIKFDFYKKYYFQFRRYGYDVKTSNYNVLLNYPNYEKPNQIELHMGEKKWQIMSDGLAEPLGPIEARGQVN